MLSKLVELVRGLGGAADAVFVSSVPVLSRPRMSRFSICIARILASAIVQLVVIGCGPRLNQQDSDASSSDSTTALATSEDEASLSVSGAPDTSAAGSSESTSGPDAGDAIIDGDLSHARIGEELSIARDFDGNGFRDVFLSAVLAAPDTDDVALAAGSPLEPTTLASDLSVGLGGWSLTLSGLVPIGDVDGDGRDDMASPARVYFFDPALDLSEQPGFALEWNPDCPPLDGALAAVGDFNGDGSQDLLIGVACTDSTPPEGGAHVVFGRATQGPFDATMPAGEGATIHAPADSLGLLGREVAGLSDVDGDGLDDIAIGSEAGTYFVRGRASDAPVEIGDAVVAGEAGLLPATSPIDVDGLLDHDGDGRPDAVVVENDAIVVIFGGEALFAGVLEADALAAAQAATIIRHPPLPAYRSIAAAGDVNGDGAGDLLVGIAFDDANDIPAGVYVVLAGPGGEESWGALAEADRVQPVDLAAGGDELGWAVASADLDGDGVIDLAWSAPGSDDAALDGGRVYLRLSM